MKMGSKRGAVLEEPLEEDSTWEVGTPRRRASKGARKAAYGGAEESALDDFADEYDEPAFRRQGAVAKGGLHLKLRRGLPKSWVGRGLFALGFLAVVGVIFAGLAGLRSALLHDSRFVMTTSEDIQLVGNHNVTRAAVLSVFGADLERNIFRVPLDERRADLERLPWVSHATVMRLLPNRIRIAVTERAPVAFVRQGRQIGLVDASGVLLDMPQDAAGDPHYSFPVLTGLSGGDPLSVRAARMVIYQRFMQELGAKSSTISEVDVSSPEDVKAVVSGGGSDILVHFGDEQFLERYQQFEAHLPEWKQQYPKLAAADMRYERQVVLEMQPGTGVPVSGDSGAASVDAVASDVEAAHAADPSAPKPVLAKAVAPKPVLLKAAVKVAPKTPARPVVKAATRPTNVPKVTGKPKPTSTAGAVSSGKAKSGNGKIFADLAAARKAQEARARKAAAAGSGAQ